MDMHLAEERHQSKTKLLDAALIVIRTKGYNATRVEDICEAASLTKGSFFHHFKSKEDLALAAAAHWGETTGAFFENCEYLTLPTPTERLLGYVDLRQQILKGDLPEFTCLVGTMAQEIYDTHPAIRDACDKSIRDHAATLEAHIAAAMQECGVEGSWTPQSLALYTQSVIQGAFVLAKAHGDPEVASECLSHLRRYLELLFKPNRLGPSKEIE